MRRVERSSLLLGLLLGCLYAAQVRSLRVWRARSWRMKRERCSLACQANRVQRRSERARDDLRGALRTRSLSALEPVVCGERARAESDVEVEPVERRSST